MPRNVENVFKCLIFECRLYIDACNTPCAIFVGGGGVVWWRLEDVRRHESLSTVVQVTTCLIGTRGWEGGGGG